MVSVKKFSIDSSFSRITIPISPLMSRFFESMLSIVTPWAIKKDALLELVSRAGSE
jgi:hypothetical protein